MYVILNESDHYNFNVKQIGKQPKNNRSNINH